MAWPRCDERGLLPRQRLTAGDEQLRAHQIDAGHQLRSPDARPAAACSSRERRTARVAVAFEQELDGAGIDVAGGPRRRDRGVAHPLPHRGVSAGQGLSSIIFWCRRWTEHSRSKRCTTLPCASAKTWISTCRGRSTSRSTYSVPSPNAACASRRARWTASSTSPRLAHGLHADAAAARRRLDQRREARSRRPPRRARRRSDRPASRRARPARRRPASGAARRSSIPCARCASAGGPTKIRPASCARAREARALGEEAVAGMHRVGAGRVARRRSAPSTLR